MSTPPPSPPQELSAPQELPQPSQELGLEELPIYINKFDEKLKRKRSQCEMDCIEISSKLKKWYEDGAEIEAAYKRRLNEWKENGAVLQSRKKQLSNEIECIDAQAIKISEIQRILNK